jgi:hypothetical protein
MTISVVQSVVLLAKETEVLEENPPLSHFMRHKSNITWSELEMGPRGQNPANNCLRYSTASSMY